MRLFQIHLFKKLLSVWGGKGIALFSISNSFVPLITHLSRSKLARHVYRRRLAACHYPENARPSLSLVESFLKFHTLKNIENIATTRKEMHVHFHFLTKIVFPKHLTILPLIVIRRRHHLLKQTNQMRVTSRPFETCLLARKNSERAKKKKSKLRDPRNSTKSANPFPLRDHSPPLL